MAIQLATPQTETSISGTASANAYGAVVGSFDTQHNTLSVQLVPGTVTVSNGQETAFTPDASGDFPIVGLNINLATGAFTASVNGASGTLPSATLAQVQAAVAQIAVLFENIVATAAVAGAVFPAGATAVQAQPGVIE